MKVEDVSLGCVRMSHEPENRSKVYAICLPVGGTDKTPKEMFMVIYHYNGHFYCTESIATCKDRQECIDKFKSWLHIRDEDVTG